jgi:hypothetical protein
MRTKPVHHPISISIGVAAPKADQVNGLTSEGVRDLAGDVMRAFHEVSDHYTVSDSFSSVRTKKALHWERVI